MADATPSEAKARMLDALYEMAGFTEKPRDRDLILEAKWLLECQFQVIIDACARYNDRIENWEAYVNETVLSRVAAFLKEKLAAEKAMMGTVVQDAVNTLEKQLDTDNSRLKKIEENIQLLGFEL